MNYLIWRGKDSRDIKGLIICELPPITKPNLRVRETQIDGVDGSIIEELGYESYTKTMAIGLTQNADIDKVIEFFTGEGEITFSNEADKYYKAKITEGIDYARLVRFKVAEVKIRVQPFKYSTLEEDRLISSPQGNSMIVENLGNYISKPIITLKGEGTVEIAVNGNNLFKYTFPTDENTVVIDCQKQDAYLGTVLKNRNMSGEFPTLEAGANTITWDGSLQSIGVSQYSRWL